MTAIEQLEHYVQFKNNWSEHMVSITVYVREEEWVRVGAWVYDHFDDVCGVSFRRTATTPTAKLHTRSATDRGV